MKKTLIATLVMSLAACGGSGGSGGSDSSVTEKDALQPTVKEVMPIGLWEGVALNNGVSYHTVVLIAPDGEARVFSDDGEQDKMTLVLDGNKFSSDLVGFDYNGALEGTGVVTGEYSSSTITGSVSVGGQQASTFSLAISDQSSDGASLSTVTGNYVTEDQETSVAIDSDGLISGSDTDGCQYEGVISVPDSSVNIYSLTLDVSSCGNGDGAYTGLATYAEIFDDSTQKVLMFQVDNGVYSVTDIFIK